MTTIAIVGAGRGLGLAVARRFGVRGHAAALVSRSRENVEALADELRSDNIEAAGFVGDVRDPDGLTDALRRAADDLGPIEVLQFSPVPQAEFLQPVLDTTLDDISAAVAFSVHGSVTAVQQVLGGMRERGRGSLLFVNGASAATPNPRVAGTSVAFAAESAYARMLHDTLTPEGIRVAQLIVPGRIRPGHPTHSPAALADRLWALHDAPGEFRTVVDEGG